MNYARLQRRGQLLLTLLAASLTPSIALAQAAPSPAATPAELAKYDLNKNGRLDPDELAAKQADASKAASAATTTPSTESNIVQLSPFEVSGEDDKGYLASSSLSGTRLNSKLEDLASSISVVTKQQLLDTAAVDINDIFSYEIGTEGTNEFTDLSNDGRGDYDNVSGNPNTSNRMRGLSSANVAVGGFTASSSIPIDTYNIDAVEIARGPNSNLAGLSDAGGSINLVTSKANVTRESTNLTFRGDSYGGFRGSIDVNRPIIRGLLSARFSAVYEEKGYIRKPSVERNGRQQLAFTFRPFKSTTITTSYENIRQFAQRPNSVTPRDTITLWKSRGSPTYDPVSRTYTVNGVRSAPITNINQLPTGIGGIGSANARILQYIDGGQILYMMRGNVPNSSFGTSSNLQQAIVSSNVSAEGPLYKVPGTTDKALYDWTDINLGASNYERQEARVLTAGLSQGILNSARNRLDFKIDWRREDQERYQRSFIAQLDGVGNTLAVDVSEKLLDGRPNPFFLHPFIGGVNPQIFRRPNLNDNYRAQLAYQLDLRHEKNILHWLGLHRASAYGEYLLSINSPSGLRYHDVVTDNVKFQPGLATLTPTTNVTSNAGALFYPRYYMGNTPGGGVEYANTGPVNPNGVFNNASFFDTTTGQWTTNERVTIEERYFAIGQQKKKIRTVGGTLQSFLLNDQVVTTFGRRKDRVYTTDSLGTTPDLGFLQETNLYNFGNRKRWREGETNTRGVVVKPFRSLRFLNDAARDGSGITRFFAGALRNLNLHYNESESFQPADTAYNLFLEQLPNPTGETKEYGFSLSLFDDKLNVRVTHQETTQANTRSSIGVVATRALGMDFHPGGQNLSFNLYDAATVWEQTLNPGFSDAQIATAVAARIGYSADYIASASGLSISDTNDALSKGWELELNFNPSRYWTLRATGNQQEATDTNISESIQKFLDLRLPTWTTVVNPLTGGLWWKEANGGQGIPENYYLANVRNQVNLAITNQGKRKPQTREYRLNVLTKYQLAGLPGDHKWLKNLAVGGVYSWASKGAIGYLAGAPDPDGVVRSLDRTKPYFDDPVGKFDLNLNYGMRIFNDRVRASLQLNVKNLTESGHLQGVGVNPDGNFWQYRIIDPRQFILTASFDF